MNTLLKAFLKAKYNYTDKQVNNLIDNSIYDGTIGEWYDIILIKLREERDRNV